MKKILLILFLAATSMVKSQMDVHHPYQTGHCEWYYEFVSVNGGPNYTYAHLGWGGDTTILGQTYTKVGAGGFREDPVSHEMFYIHSDNVEYDITIDQNMEVGDTLFFNPFLEVSTRLSLFGLFVDDPYAIVREIDSVEVQGQYRKVFVLGDYNSGNDYHNEHVDIAVGIGIIGYYSFEYYGSLVCYSMDNNLIYGASQNPLSMNCTAALSETSGQVKFNIFPNPSVGEISLQYDESNQIDRIYISDLQGKLVYEISNKSFPEPININDLMNGVYFVNVESNGFTSQQKLVKTN